LIFKIWRQFILKILQGVFYRQWQTNTWTYTPNQDEVRKYERREGARTLASLLEEV